MNTNPTDEPRSEVSAGGSHAAGGVTTDGLTTNGTAPGAPSSNGIVPAATASNGTALVATASDGTAQRAADPRAVAEARYVAESPYVVESPYGPSDGEITHPVTPNGAGTNGHAAHEVPPAADSAIEVAPAPADVVATVETLPPAPTEPAAASIATPLADSTYVESVSGPPAVPPSEPPTAYGDASPAPEEDEEAGMTMLEHLEELRVRLIVCSVAVVVGLILSAMPIPFLTQTDDGGLGSVSAKIMEMVARPAAGYLIYLKPGEGFITYFQVAMLVGFALAMPVILYQVIAFVLPALLPHEKKYLYMAVPGAMGSFLLGLSFGYVLVLPVAIEFLKTFSPLPPGVVSVQWAFSEYVGTVTTLLFYMGLAFETPLIMFFLTKLHVISPRRLVRFRKYALILAFVIGAIITPTPDPLNQTIVSVPLYLLFELGLLLSKLAEPTPAASEA